MKPKREIRFVITKKEIELLMEADSHFLGEFSGKTIKGLEKDFSGASYAQFKETVAEYIVAGLAPFQKRYAELKKDTDEVMKILEQGKDKASAVANVTLRDVKEKIGFLL